MAMFVTAKRSVSVIGGWRTAAVDEELRLKRLKDFQRGGKRLRQIQLLNVDELPIKKIKTTAAAPLSSGAIKEEALGGRRTISKLSGKSQTIVSSSGKQSNIIGMKVVAEIPVGRKASLGETDKIRDKIREDLAKSLSKVASEVDEKGEEAAKVSSCDPLNVAAMVETELFRAWGSCSRTNKAKYWSVMFNLKDDKNPDFRKKVLLGEFSPESISQLTAKDMASQARKLENEQIRGLPKFNHEILPAPESKGEGNSELQCRRCEFSATTYSQMQTRSADEPMTILVHCHNCDHNWKVS
ncbi:OLC1v1021050C1 [Oldenlandia corymbosa var. corymbosa]|uniref:OLC1v1021050C1 n=1 Tax=Oldenlandia corymbosa var. corymbosa TaxID=529605 RepID=A0AAV1BYE9_OLDCO|nr:OLC1v1021050C1 [Oldenlandia corymbosa var. corymbosa]